MFRFLIEGCKGLNNRFLETFMYDYKTIEEEYTTRSLKKMITVLDANSTPDEFEVIDSTKSVIIAVKSDNNYIQSRLDGTFDLTAEQNYSLSGVKVCGSFMEFLYRPKIKMSIPKGMKVNFEAPYSNQITNKIYYDFDMKAKMNVEKEVADCMIYNKLNFVMHIDNTRVMNLGKPFSFPENTALINFYFTYVFMADDLPQYEKIYLIKSDEVFSHFEEYYS